MSTRYGLYIRDESGRAMMGITVMLKNTGTLTEYTLSNAASDRGFYYHASLPDGTYDVYVNGVLQTDMSPISVDNE